MKLARGSLKMKVDHYQGLAAPQGFEPRYSAPEADVLPLNEGATNADGNAADRL
jgi:hypothetical protein